MRKKKTRRSAEARGLGDAVSVQVLQDQTQVMLHEYCSAHGYRANAAPGRFGKLLLLLPSLRAVPGQLVVDAFFRHVIGDVPISRLLVDLMAAV